MGLKLSDALRLSWSNIAQYKKRSAMVVLTISVLFGVILGFNFITSGMEETIISASAGQTGGEVYVEARYGNSSTAYYDSIYSPEEIAQVSLAPVLKAETDQKIRERVAEYNGEIVGYYWYYQLDYPYRVIDKSVVEAFVDEGLWRSVPDGKVPVLMPEGWTPPTYSYGGESDTHLRDRLGDTFYRVGSIPGTELGRPTLDGFNPLNVILSQLTSATNYDFWLVDDGSGEIEEYIAGQLAEYLAEDGSWYTLAPVQKTAVAKFSDPYQAAAYVSPDEEKFGVKFYSESFRYHAQDLFGTTVMAVGSFNAQRVLLIAVEILLLIVAVIVAVLTFAHLIDSDAATVALYRAMGASTDSIYLIYLMYLLELCILAIAMTVAMAFLFIGVLALTSAGALAARLQAFYALSYLPKITLFRLNGAFWFILLAILAVAPLSLFFTLRRFSAKHIAKKLKED